MQFRLMRGGLLILALGFLAPFVTAQANERPLESLAKGLAEQIAANVDGRPRVTVLDFTDIRNRPNELGRYLALNIANEMVTLGEVAVLDRANLETIMAEHELTAAGLLRPDDARKLGQFAGVDAILIGSISSLGDNIELIVRAISTETSEIVGSGSTNLQATSDFRQMLSMQVDSGAITGSTPRAGGSPARTPASPTSAVATEGDAIAIREVGPVELVLRNVTRHAIETGGRSSRQQPAIRCTFDINNRSLNHTAVIAANQRLADGSYSFAVIGFRGDLVDSNGARWQCMEVRGVPGVSGFETARQSSASIHQPNPAGVVRYIKTATRHDGGRQSSSTAYWAGNFSEISPADTLRMTVDFVPAATVDGDVQDYSWPSHFQFDLELVLGTVTEDQAPEEAADLLLRNLTIDEILLPRDAR